MAAKPEGVQNAQTVLNRLPPSASLQEMIQTTTESIGLILSSPVSFFHFLEPDQKTLAIQAWWPPESKSAFSGMDAGQHLTLTEAIHQRRAVIDNHPSGNAIFMDARITRLLVAPVIRDQMVVAVAGVANKTDEYTPKDADLLVNYSDLVWNLVSEKKRIELYQNLVDATNDWETLVDEQNTFRYCSTNCEKITGFTCEEFNQDPELYIKMVHPEDRPAVVEHFEKMHINRDPSSLVFRARTKSGDERWIELYCRAFYDSQGQYLGRRGSNRDITERKLLELELKKKEESLERSQRIAHLGSYEVDLLSNQLLLSEECYRILGLSANEPQILFSEKAKIVHPEDFDRVVDQLTASIFAGTGFDISFRIRRPDGEIRCVQNIGKPKKNEAGEVFGIFGTIQDITEKKIIENSLLESENRFRSVLDNASSMAVQGYAPDGTVQYWNHASSLIYGYSQVEALGKNLVDLIIPPEMRSEVKAAITKMWKTGEVIPSAELSLMRKDGSRVEVFSSHAVINRLNHEPELFCIDLDLSARKKMEAALRESEERFRSLVESISDIIFSLKEDGSVLYISPTWRQVFEAEVEDAVGMSFLPFLHPDELPMIFSHFEQLLKTGEKIEGLELRIKDKHGVWQWHSVNAALQKETDGGARTIVGIMRNITETKRAEKIRDAEIEIMNICHFATNKESLLRELVDYFKRLTGMDAVGVRLHAGNDYPYFAVQGFSDEHLEKETSLCIKRNGILEVDKDGIPRLDCLCGHILMKQFDPSRPYFTKFGSFFTNSTTDFTKSISTSDNLGQLRNYCNQEGYESVALIPLHTQGKMFGLFQFNDRRRDGFTNGLMQQLENLVDYVALALANLESTEALRESEEKYRILIENASEGICVLQDGACMFSNPKLLETSGYSARDLPVKNMMEIIHPEDRDLVERYQQDRLQGNSTSTSIICRYLTQEGEMRWMELSAAPITWGGRPATLNFLSDVTSRKVAQDALRDSEIKLHDMIDNFDGAIWAVDKDFKLIIFNSTYQNGHKNFFGRDIALGDDLHELRGADEETVKEWREIHARVMRGEHIVLERESGLPNEIKFVEVTYTPIRNADQEVIGVTVMVRDISERKENEQERRALEEKFFNAFHTSPDSISINSMYEGLFIDVNEGFTTMTGYTAEEVVGKSAMEFNLWVNPHDRMRMIESLKRTGEMINLETPTRTKDGRVIMSLMSCKTINVNGEDCILTISRDISERKQAEAQLNEQIEELRRWHAVTLGRETRILDLKKEVNELLISAGKPPRYAVNGESPHV